MSKPKSFGQFIEQYEPLQFRFMGLKRHEHTPRPTVFYALHWLRLRIKSELGIKITYFDLRALVTPEQQKNGDLMFLTAWSRKRDWDAEDESRTYRVRRLLTTFRYYPELYYIGSMLRRSDFLKHDDRPPIDDYMVRWCYGLDIKPSFIDLVNGTSRELALETIDELM